METGFVFNPFSGEFDMVCINNDVEEQDTLQWEEI